MDNTLLDIIAKATKRMYINHAKLRGANRKLIRDLDKSNWRTVCHVVTILYGEPLTPREMKFKDRKLIR